MARLKALLAVFVMALAGFAWQSPAQAANQPPRPTKADLLTVGVHAAKGHYGLKTGARAALLPAQSFFYNLAEQGSVTGSGLQANLITANPYLDATNDAHSLAELAVRSANLQNTIEVGWTKDPIVCAGKANNVCLFVFHWVNGVAACYNGCGWVDYAPTAFNVGDAVPVGVQKRFIIQHSGSEWWIGYGDPSPGVAQWLGYYPDSLWGGTFTQGGHFQGFGEVAGGRTVGGVVKPCTDMGNGLRGDTSSATSARVGSLSILTGSVPNNFTMTQLPTMSPVGVWNLTALSNRTMAYGGPGYNAAGTGVGTAGAC